MLLLAAGASRRMGQAKQLLSWGTHTLIEHQLETLLKTGQPVVVVLGHLSDRMETHLERYPVLALTNRDWKKGMGTSIAFGIQELDKKFPKAAGALITQLDQPLLTEEHFHKMLSMYHPGLKEIIVSRTEAGWEGVPVLFDRYYFKALQDLRGEEGARKIFRQHPRFVRSMESGDLLEDMDTPEAYQDLLAKYKRRS